MRPDRASIVHTTTCYDPPYLAFASALMAAIEAVRERVGNYPEARVHMGGEDLDMADPSFVEAVRKDMKAHGGIASVVYRWGPDDGAFETITAIPRGGAIVVIWLGEAEHADVVALSARLRAAN